MAAAAKNIILIISIALNVLFCAFLGLALTVKSASLSVYNLDERDNPRLTAAVAVNAPTSQTVVFNAVEITLKKGEQAALQFSALTRGRQTNWLITTLYDHEVIAVEPTGYGVIITALREGRTVMQTLSEDGFKDVALVTVGE
jgi:hypothetical protein